ncbi:ROK family transcriptional regulator [Sphingomonas floccifaciens]|uniref:ROK family transcriptional regulator n=1 Tax=Sphingomonas floccifaciens TaxID=1844115 RepID=A0ABW4NGB3_9SPHN
MNAVMHGLRKGTNASGMRRYNERLILSAVRRLNGASKADLSRVTGLSPQAVVRIVDELADGGTLIQSGKRTGGMGQPAIIYRINGKRGYTVGLEVGRGGLTIALLDFDGERQAVHRPDGAFPSITRVIDEVNGFLHEHLATKSLLNSDTFLGVGIAMPWFIGEWREELGISVDQASEWRGTDVAHRLSDGIAWPTHFENDGNAATLAQLLCGAGINLQDFLSVNLGTFIGGGLVLSGRVVQGRHGNAGALASMPVPTAGHEDYLIHHASLYSLPADPKEQDLAAWIERCADALGFAVIGANSLLDLEAVVIDGAAPQPVIDGVAAALERRLSRNVPPDFFAPAVRTGRLGSAAAAVGAGLLPLHASFSPDLSALFKPAASG